MASGHLLPPPRRLTSQERETNRRNRAKAYWIESAMRNEYFRLHKPDEALPHPDLLPIPIPEIDVSSDQGREKARQILSKSFDDYHQQHKP